MNGAGGVDVCDIVSPRSEGEGHNGGNGSGIRRTVLRLYRHPRFRRIDRQAPIRRHAASYLRELLSKIHNPPPTNAGALARSDFRAQSISDAVALSAAANAAGLGAIIHSVNQLAVDLLTQGFFIRERL
jgi:hypothetical protein